MGVHERVVEGRRPARPRQRALQRNRGVGAEQRTVEADRVVHEHAALEPARIVVGKLVQDYVGPHLQRVDRGVATAAARHSDGQAEGRGNRCHGRDRRRQSEPAACKWQRRPSHHRAQGKEAKGAA